MKSLIKEVYVLNLLYHKPYLSPLLFISLYVEPSNGFYFYVTTNTHFHVIACHCIASAGAELAVTPVS